MYTACVCVCMYIASSLTRKYLVPIKSTMQSNLFNVYSSIRWVGIIY